jgi:hypothetical protein
MKLRTKRSNEWIEIEKDGCIAKFLVSVMTPKESLGQLASFTKYSWEKNQRVEKIEYYKLRMDTINKTILDWEGIENEDGDELECNEKNKEIIYLYNAPLIEEVLEKTQELLANILKQEEEERKN